MWDINKKKPTATVPNAHGPGRWICAVAALPYSDLVASGTTCDQARQPVVPHVQAEASVPHALAFRTEVVFPGPCATPPGSSDGIVRFWKVAANRRALTPVATCAVVRGRIGREPLDVPKGACTERGM